MRLEYNAPARYISGIPIFNGSGLVANRVVTGLENVLAAYVDFAKIHSRVMDNNPLNYTIARVFVVGSGARENRVDSDLDLLLIAPTLDEASARQITLTLNSIYFADRPKPEAIDTYVRKENIFPDRTSQEITKDKKINPLIRKYMQKLRE